MCEVTESMVAKTKYGLRVYAREGGVVGREGQCSLAARDALWPWPTDVGLPDVVVLFCPVAVGVGIGKT